MKKCILIYEFFLSNHSIKHLLTNSFQIKKIHIERVQYNARPYVGDQPTAGQAERNCEDPVRPAGEPDFLR